MLLTALLSVAAALQAPAAPPAGPILWRLDCGEIHISDLDMFSDAFLYEGQSKTLTDSCYLIRHGDRYLLWDTGLPGELVGRSVTEGSMRVSVRTRVRDQLARIGVTPAQITFVGISHYHDDHIGQAADFPGATLLIGTEDWEAIQRRPESAARLQPWIDAPDRVRTANADHDVFGDGSVVMLDMPGHTPGHHALLVRFRGQAPLLLTGDLLHFTEQVANAGVPSFNTDRADTMASMARFMAIADSLDAEIVIQHEPDDVAKLPAFPESAH